MATVHDFIEDWIEMRSKLQRQLKVLGTGEINARASASGNSSEATATRIKKCLDELNALLKENATADRP
jgi:hypothetical protein